MKSLICLSLIVMCKLAHSQSSFSLTDTNLPCKLEEMVSKYGIHQIVENKMYDSLLLHFYNTNLTDTFFDDMQFFPKTFSLTIIKNISNWTFISIYDCDGILLCKTGYQKNKKYGLECYYHYNGIISSAANYINDTLETPFYYQYDMEGRKSHCNYKTNSPEPDSLVIYDTNGIIVQSEKYIYGLGGVSNQYFFYPNGQIYISNLCAQHGKPGIYTKYYEDGTLMEKGAKYGNPREGEWLFYFPNGEIKMKVMFGIPINYQEVKDGPTEYFYDDGQHLKTEIYKKGTLKKIIWNPRYGPQSK